ncbi:MAG: PEGA domain-containing protein [Deltaproteobacteria bacterium]|nr:PEGA domain-containing protein [Deltaproteobacteria bacterium]
MRLFSASIMFVSFSLVFSCAHVQEKDGSDNKKTLSNEKTGQGKKTAGTVTTDLSSTSPSGFVIPAGPIEGKGGIFIKTNPEGAMVQLDGLKQKGRTPLVIEGIPAGKHYLFANTGDKGGGREIDVLADRFTKLELPLHPLGGRAIILSYPPEADLIMNGKPAGMTPIVLSKLSPGEYSFEITKPGYARDRFKATFRGSEIQRFERKLLKAGKLVLKSDAKGQPVKLDGIPVGKLPLEMDDLAEGEYIAAIASGPYSGSTLKVHVKAGKTSVYNWNLAKVKCTLNLSVSPKIAKVYIDGKEAGHGPKLGVELPCGKHQVEAKHWRYLAQKVEVDLEPHNKNNVKISLKTAPGSLKVISVPKNALVIVNAKINAGKTPVTMRDVPAGTYDLEIKLQGYETVSRTVLVRPKKETKVSVTLRKK